MNLQQNILLAYLEEDNITRAYFRAIPLLSAEGLSQDEAKTLWPDLGSLRIVPDRAEQMIFKDRMRALNNWCVIDAVGIPPETSKIRTNKNYRPQNGESNQFILYSDTVKPLPEHTFFELMEGNPSDAEKLAPDSVTPLFYILSGDTLYGPVSKADPKSPSAASPADGTLYSVPCPDGKTRSILLIPSEEKLPPVVLRGNAARVQQESNTASAVHTEEKSLPATAPDTTKKEEEERLPIGQALNILDNNRDFSETIAELNAPVGHNANLLRAQVSDPVVPAATVQDPPMDKGFSGTPLYRSALRTSVPAPKNKLQEVVSSQWRAAKYEPPAEALPAGIQMQHIENPVENACELFSKAWEMTGNQTQLTDHLLALPGFRAKVTDALTAHIGSTALQDVMTSRLNDLEAERLNMLIQLDLARTNLEEFRRQAVDDVLKSRKKDEAAAREIMDSIQKSIEAFKAELKALTVQRDAMLASIEEARKASITGMACQTNWMYPPTYTPLKLTPSIGENVGFDTIVATLEKACTEAGLTIEHNQVIALLLLIATTRRFGFISQQSAAASTFMEMVVRVLGWQSGYAQKTDSRQFPLLTTAPASATPAILLTVTEDTPVQDNITKLLLAKQSTQMIHLPAYEADPWPMYLLPPLPAIALPDREGITVSLASLLCEAAEPAVSRDYVKAALKPVLDFIEPMSATAISEMTAFAALASVRMEGGMPAACDWAIRLWVIPWIRRDPRMLKSIRPLLTEYPLSTKALG